MVISQIVSANRAWGNTHNNGVCWFSFGNMYMFNDRPANYKIILETSDRVFMRNRKTKREVFFCKETGKVDLVY